MSIWVEEPIVFECCGESLVGILHNAGDHSACVGVLVLVGGPQYRVGSHRQFVLMARALASRGFPVFRFDYRGMGDSSGAMRSFEDVGEDVRSAMDAFQRKLSGKLDRIVLFGLCDAASAVLMHGAADPRVEGLVLANPWVRSEQGEARSFVRHYYLQRFLQRSFWRKVLSGEFHIMKSAADFIRTLVRSRRTTQAKGFVERMLEGLSGFRGPVLLLMSGQDLTAREFDDLCEREPKWRAALARPNLQVVRLQDADHTFSSRKDLDFAVRQIEACLLSPLAKGHLNNAPKTLTFDCDANPAR